MLLFINEGISQILFQKKITNGNLNDIIQTNDGGFITCGILPYNNSNIPPNGTITKIDINGNIQWAKQYLPAQYSGSFGSIIQTKDGGYIALAGYNTSTNSANPNFLPFIVKTDVNGNIQWSKIVYSNPIYGNLFIRQTFDKGYAIVCNTFLQGGSNIQFIKTDSSGSIIWNKLYMSSITINPIITTSFIQTTDGGYFMSSGITIQHGGVLNTTLLKIDNQGNIEWSKMFITSDGNPEGGHVVQTNDNGYILSDAEAAGTLAKLDSVGNIVWERILYEPPNLYIGTNAVYNFNNNGLVYNNDGSFTIFGNNCLIKTDSLGVLQWAKIYKKTYGFYCGIQIQGYEGSASGFAALGGLSYTDTFIIKTDAYGNSICDSNITIIDSLITPATTNNLSITVTSAGTLLSNIATVVNSINIQDSVLCIGTVGINKITNPNEEISVYPNPATSFIQVSVNNEQLVKINLFDVLDNEILQTKQKHIDASNLPNGIYFIHVETLTGITTKKLIVQH